MIFPGNLIDFSINLLILLTHILVGFEHVMTNLITFFDFYNSFRIFKQPALLVYVYVLLLHISVLVLLMLKVRCKINPICKY